MDWKEKLGQMERERAKQLAEASAREANERLFLETEIHKAFEGLGIIGKLESIRDEFWGAGEICKDTTGLFFDTTAELFYNYPVYIHGYSTDSMNGDSTHYPPEISLFKEFLKFELRVPTTSHLDSVILNAYFYQAFHRDYSTYNKICEEYSRKLGKPDDNRFLTPNYSSYKPILITGIKLGGDLSNGKTELEKALLEYCAVKSLLPRQEILENYSVNVIKALNGELPVSTINQDAVRILRESGLLH